MMQPTPKQAEFQKAHRAFHARIAAKAAEVRPVKPQTYSIPNAPYGTPKQGVQVIRARDRYVHPKEFNAAYEEAWDLEICGIEKLEEAFSSKIMMDRVKRAVASFYRISLNDLLSDRRAVKLVIPRHLAMYLCRELTPRSFVSIGRAFGGRDHTTIMGAIKNTEARMAREPDFAQVVAVLRSKCEGGE